MNAFVIKRPVITEKSLQQANEKNIYLFEVNRQATKHQIRAAVEMAFKVRVIDVNTVMSQSKLKATGRKRIKTATAKSKKALVKLAAGNKINVFDLTGSSTAQEAVEKAKAKAPAAQSAKK